MNHLRKPRFEAGRPIIIPAVSNDRLPWAHSQSVRDSLAGNSQQGGSTTKSTCSKIRCAVGYLTTRGPFLSPAYDGSRHAGIAVLMLACSFFEAFAEFFEGQSSDGRSGQYFAIGFQRTFPDLQAMVVHLDPGRADDILRKVIAVFYSQLRCGLFHEAMFRNRILIDPNANNPIQITIDTESHEVASVILSPGPFLERVETTLTAYAALLRDETKTRARENFERFWDWRAAQPAAITVRPELFEQFRIVAAARVDES